MLRACNIRQIGMSVIAYKNSIFGQFNKCISVGRWCLHYHRADDVGRGVVVIAAPHHTAPPFLFRSVAGFYRLGVI